MKTDFFILIAMINCVVKDVNNCKEDMNLVRHYTQNNGVMKKPNCDVSDAKMTLPVDVVTTVEDLDVYPTYDTFCKCAVPKILLTLILCAYVCCLTVCTVVEDGNAF